MFQIRLRELRESAGYKSQQSFADAFGCRQSTVAGWESGRRMPRYDTMQQLAKFFDVSAEDLLGFENKKQATPVGKKEQTHNVIRIAGRDGSMFECTVSDSQRDLIKQMLVNLKPVDNENV